MQKAVQNTATRLLTTIGFSGPSQSNTAPVPEGCLSHSRATATFSLDLRLSMVNGRWSIIDHRPLTLDAQNAQCPMLNAARSMSESRHQVLDAQLSMSIA